MPTINELMGILKPFFKVHKSRLDCLAQVVVALLTVRTVNLVELAQAFVCGCTEEARYRRLQRFFSEFTGFTFTVLSKFLIALFNLRGPWQLSMDRTNWRWGKIDINILMLSIKHDYIAIPIVWLFLPKKGNSNLAERIKLIETFINIFGTNHIDELFADREFVSTEWFAWLRNKGIRFTIRIKQNILVESLQGNCIYVRQLFSHLTTGKTRYFKNARLILGNELYLAATKTEENEWVIVATTHVPECALTRYRGRWAIETLFGFLKSKGFNFEDTHMTIQSRLHNLLGVLTIAFCFAYKAGLIAMEKIEIKLRQHGRRTKSVFRVGLDALRESLTGIPRTVSNFLIDLLGKTGFQEKNGVFNLIFSGV